MHGLLVLGAAAGVLRGRLDGGALWLGGLGGVGRVDVLLERLRLVGQAEQLVLDRGEVVTFDLLHFVLLLLQLDTHQFFFPFAQLLFLLPFEFPSQVLVLLI